MKLLAIEAECWCKLQGFISIESLFLCWNLSSHTISKSMEEDWIFYSFCTNIDHLKEIITVRMYG